MGIWPVGSGSDFARHVGVRPDSAQFAEVLQGSSPRRFDAGRVTCREAEGRPVPRHFATLAACGLPGDVALGVQRRGKRLGGTLTYLVEAVRVVARARPRSIALVVDGVSEAPTRYHLVVVANTSTMGGGMRVAPAADPGDGWLELVTVGARSRAGLLALLPRAYTGGHVGRPGVTVRRIQRLEISAAEACALNIDGEVWGTLPAVVEILPGVLPVLAPA